MGCVPQQTCDRRAAAHAARVACEERGRRSAVCAVRVRWQSLAAILIAAPLALAAIDRQGELARAAEPPKQLTIHLASKDADLREIEVRGFTPAELAALRTSELSQEDWRRALQIRVASLDDAPAMAGTYRLAGQVAVFRPLFPFRPGVKYAAVLAPRALAALRDRPEDVVRTILALPRPPSTPAQVVAVFPSQDVLPENLLKFYIHFNVPMSQRQAYRHLRLLDGEGQPVADPFLELGEELWSPDGKRFTLLFDPGRIKRGLKPREEVGPVFEAGKTYTLEVSASWPDAQGKPLKAPLRKTFRVSEPDDRSPDPRQWKLGKISPGTRQPLQIRFDEPLDHAMLHRVLWIRVGDRDEPLAGELTVGDKETRWQFQPLRPWPQQPCTLVVDTNLEDRAGNSIGRLFDVDVFEKIQVKPQQRTLTLPLARGSGPRE